MELSDPESTGSLGELVTRWRAPLAITTSLAVLQQLTGNGNILNHSPSIFRMAHFKGPAPVVMLGVVKVVATVVAILKVMSCHVMSCHCHVLSLRHWLDLLRV